ncbi:MAG: hypothetical protein EON47_12480, partial [Acetobacteraceae bacterium]
MLRWIGWAAVLALATSPAGALELPRTWQSQHFAGNPLVRTLAGPDGRPVAVAALEEAIAAARYVLVGETHDNPDHHLIQAAIVADLGPRKPALVFEMITADEAPALVAFLGDPQRTAAGLGPAVRWNERGWPDYAMYQPIAEAALGAGLQIRPGDLGRETARKIGRQGFAALGPGEASRLGLERPMPEDAAAALTDELRESHCGMLPDAALPGMLNVQRARDAVLADAMIAAAVPTGAAVLVAGSGHARADRGAPAAIRARQPEPGAAMIAIGLVEVTSASADLAALGISPETPAPYDFVLFTPKADISDPCE